MAGYKCPYCIWGNKLYRDRKRLALHIYVKHGYFYLIDMYIKQAIPIIKLLKSEGVGALPPLTFARYANIPYEKIYKVIDQLERMGLVRLRKNLLYLL